MRTKDAEALMRVHLPGEIVKGPDAEAVFSLLNDLRDAAAKACKLPVEALAIEIMLTPKSRQQQRPPLLLQ
jgi:hypothetical protein